MVAIYARQSVDKKDSISIESQIENCKKELEERTSGSYEEYKTYIDKGYSGKNTDRPKFLEMINDIENGLVNKVIVYKIDRISRAIIDFARIVELFNKYNVKFVSRTEKFDTSTPMGNAVLNIIMVFAQLERETIQLRVKDNYYARGRQGFYLGGVAPFGYDKIQTTHQGKKTYTFLENTEQAQIVCNLFDEYANTDISLGKLAEQLTKSGITTNFENAWSGVSLGRLLRNPVYVQANADVYLYLKSKGATMNNDVSEYIGENGCYVYAERHKITKSKFTDLTDNFVSLALHKGIILPDTWLKCQYKLNNNKQVKNSGKGTHTWLSGIIKCGYCGLAINVVTNTRSKTEPLCGLDGVQVFNDNNRGNNYINCGGRKQRICFDRKKVIHISDIEEVVQTELLEHMKNLKVEATQDVSLNSPELNQLNIKRVHLEEKISSLVSRLSDASDISMTYINQELYKLDFELKEVMSEILSQSEKRKNKNNYGDIKIEDCVSEWSSFTMDEKKKLAKIFIEKVVVTDDEISVFYN